MALNKNFDPIAGLFNNIEHIKPESSTNKKSKSAEAVLTESSKGKKQVAVTESSNEEKLESIEPSNNEEQETSESLKDEKAGPVKDEKQEVTESSKDEEQEITAELPKDESNSNDETSEDKTNHEVNEKDSADITLKNPNENKKEEILTKSEEPDQESKSEKETDLYDSVKKAELIPSNALSDLDMKLVTNGTTIPKEQKRWLERTAIKKGISREQYIARILANEYQVKTKIDEFFADIFVENFNKSNKSNVRFNYRIPAYLNEYLETAASENGMKKNVMLSYFINEEQKHEHRLNQPVKTIEE